MDQNATSSAAAETHTQPVEGHPAADQPAVADQARPADDQKTVMAEAPQLAAEGHTAATDDQARTLGADAGAAQAAASGASDAGASSGQDDPVRPHVSNFLGSPFHHRDGRRGTLASLRQDRLGFIEAIRLQDHRGRLTDWLSPDGFEPAE